MLCGKHFDKTGACPWCLIEGIADSEGKGLAPLVRRAYDRRDDGTPN